MPRKKIKSEGELLETIAQKLEQLIIVCSMRNANKVERKKIASNSKLSKRKIEKLTGIDRHEF